MIMKYQFLDISKFTSLESLPDPRELTSAEEVEILAQCKAQIDPGQLEAEFQELLGQPMVSLAKLIKEWEEDDKQATFSPSRKISPSPPKGIISHGKQ